MQENDLFLFKLKKNHGSIIVGGGFFVKYINIPISLAWDAFKEQNGAETQIDFLNKIRKLRERNSLEVNNTNLGCIILTDTFWFDEDKWIESPADWKSNIVAGAKYNSSFGEGKRVFDELQYMLASDDSRYSITETKHRLGQGSFRVLVTEAYNERCAISGEKTLPVLEAACL